MDASTEVEVVTWFCESGQHGKCKGRVLSIATGDRDCQCPHHEEER